MSENYPRHVGIIMDGNRRWAKKKGMEPWKGHEEGEKKFEKLLEWCKDFDIKELTLYTFSMQNFKRSQTEIDVLMKILIAEGKKILEDSEFNDKNVKIKFLGRLHLFPEKVQDMMNKVMDKTKNNDGYLLNLAMGYGGREEIVDAVKEIIIEGAKPDEITEDLVTSHMYLKDYPELIIRTSGEKRTSNFLLWQSAYSEWAFVDKYWPDFSKEDFKACLDDYSSRERRIGK